MSDCSTGVSTGVLRKPRNFWYFFGFVWYFLDFLTNIKVFGQNNVIFSFSNINDAESSRNFIKNLVLDPKHAKLDQKSLRKVYRKYTESSKTSKTCPGRPIRAHKGPYGPMWAHMGPYGPLWAHIWAHMGPYGPIWTFLDRSWRSWKIPYTFRKLSVETFRPISHVSGPKLVF